MRFRSLLTLVLGALILSPTLGSATTLFGVGSGTGVDALYTIDPSTASPTLVGATGCSFTSGLAAQPGSGALFSTGSSCGGSGVEELVTLDAITGAATSVVGISATLRDLAFTANGDLFGTTGTFSSGGFSIVKIDLSNGGFTTIAANVGGGGALATDALGRLLVVGGGTLQIVDTTNGTLSPAIAGSPGLGGFTSMVVFDTTGAYVLANCNRNCNGEFATLDLTDASTSSVGTPSPRMFGLAILPEPAAGMLLGLALPFLGRRRRA